jgi:hypothetical protein
MKGHYEVPSQFTSRQAHVSNDAANSSAGHKHAMTFAPDLVQFSEEALVVFRSAELPVGARIFFKGPIRGRRNNEVNGCIRTRPKVTSIAERK